MRVITMNCPDCGAPVSIGDKECAYCGSSIIITSFSAVSGIEAGKLNSYISNYQEMLKTNPDNNQLNLSTAFCYLQLKIYDKALFYFERAIQDNFRNSETFFYAAVCLLNGKKAFLTRRETINKIETYINAARSTENRGIYAYFHAYIKYDYFKRKSLITEPQYMTLLEEAQRLGVSEYDIKSLYSLLNVERPEAL